MSDFLTFRRMVAPVVIQIVFWLGSVAVIVFGVAGIVIGAHHNRASEVVGGFMLLLFGPLVLRLYCEVLIVAFRINDSLTDIQKLAVWAAERVYAGEPEDEEDEDEHDS